MPASLPNHDIAQLYQEHHSWVYAWLYKKLGNSSDAADLAQDTFLRVMARRQQIELLQPRAYLTTVAKGLMINWIQRKHIERAYLDVLALQPELEEISPEQHCLIIESLLEVTQLLEQLPAVVRDTFLYAQLEGLKYDEIAVKLDISLSSVKRYMKKAYVHCLSAMLDD
ncbi:sigma-70 family RNA polymerase sigma factor [Acinetobacter guillouiae]|jgi:RNA polymerase sigma-70 factor (ECF subfamily)|uniref:Sigma-70 family RNA polymerase sigma factor n=1 Tax=Acinetobacter guillouiae TaxID=106649 RepID=A0A8X8GGU8_ACIGI|nr:sigma-70 family RNA polymerase sigma factor [Acinetobacter guillouiae]MCF0263497.1 sigma-70 family RNA polymerase sigma factor [Acinetobacter guillouiae]